MKKLEQILNELKIEQIVEDLLLNEEDYYSGLIPYRSYSQNKRALENELNYLKNRNKEVTHVEI